MAIATIELVLAAFFAILVLSEIISQKASVPFTLVLVFVGISVTALSSLASLASNPLANSFQSIFLQMRASYDVLVKGGLFVGLVVPPLVFEAMMHIRATDLRAMVRPAVVLATVGVAITTVVGGVILWQVAGLSFATALLFAAIISPTDSVTVLEVFRRVTAPSRLATLMDLEAALNDATGIIIFSIVLSSITSPGIPVLASVFQFIFTFAGGVVVGLVLALGAQQMRTVVQDRMALTILTISAVYGSYVLATGLGVSGLIAVAVVGLYFGNVTMNSAMEPSVKDTVQTFWQIAAFLGNSIAFLLIGVETDILTLSESIVLILVAYLAITVARAVTVYPIIALTSQTGQKIPITWSNTAMLGGVRGALSIALAATVTESSVLSGQEVHSIATMVLGVAFLSIAIQVPILSRYMRRAFGGQTVLSP